MDYSHFVPAICFPIAHHYNSFAHDILCCEQEMSFVRHFTKNTVGNDYVVGDIHGCFNKLTIKLQEIGFNPGVDRLFSVGDLVDRGPESEEAYEWLSKPWFHAVKGNHEQMAIDHFQGYGDASIYVYNGGAWFLAMTKPEQRLFVDEFSAMPLAIDVETEHGLIGIIHAECPTKDWAELDEALHNHNAVAYENVAMWNRDKINYKDESVVDGIHKLFVGHTPLKKVVELGNVIYIDTAACFNGKFTVYNLNTLEEV